MRKQLIVSVVLAAMLSACESVLDKTPIDTISSENFWQTEEDFRFAANDLYTYLSLDVTRPNWSVDYFQRGTNAVSSGTHVVSNTDPEWNSAYQGIRRANEILEFIEEAPISQAAKDRYGAEAKFFRGYLYFNLLQRFGGVPAILTLLDFESKELTSSRASREETMAQIIADLQDAAALLPKKSELPAEDAGRVTRGAALGMLSRAALFEGTMQKYHDLGNPVPYLETARSAALDFINEGEYPLIDDFSRIYSEDNENHSEIVLVKWFKENVTGTSPLGRGLIIDLQIAPTKYLADAFLCTDGLPIENSSLFQGYNTLDSEFENRDPRMDHTLWRPGTDYGGTPLLPDFRISSTGYYLKKPGDVKALEVTFVYTDQILMRSAEILLNFAEASYELNGSISDGDLDISINALRQRVGMPPLTIAFVSGANPAGVQLDMLEEIRRERRIELAGEGFRYYDLIRWKTAEAELPRPVLGIKFHESDFPGLVVGEDIILNEDGFVLAQTAASRSFEAPKHYLFPIPLGEIALNGNLEQNPGWK
ncbi:MAG TPA: RagB/SusD family nutrient uptake outer membrane protein [Anseongella sp.]